jgi:predicted ATPase/transcriptional regulator with XRE-family HTH domain
MVKSDKALPHELFLMYRQRSGLTQIQLSEAIGVKSVRTLSYWEGGYNLPKADRLRRLIEFYLQQGIFNSSQERVEVKGLWDSVKAMFDTNSEKYETYPVFDEAWFEALLSIPAKTEPEISIVNPKSKIVNQSNLPEPPDQLLGRESEIAEITTLLLAEKTRLITLTGVGGTGKTRLALAVATYLTHPVTSADFLPHPFKDGIYFIALETVTELNSVISTLIQTLKVKEMPGQSPLATLKGYLADRAMLLVLDNFEQLVTQAATLLPELLKAAPKLKLLVTSRELLRVSLEKEYRVEPLALPQTGNRAINTGNLAEYPAIALFGQRAQTVKPDFQLTSENAATVTEICRKLDGLPLAIELAAARVKLLPPAKLLERLNLKLLTGGARDLAARQQTLYEAINWSYDLLTEAEKQLFRRLAIFAGGCTLEVAEAVCNVKGDLTVAVLDGLESLLNKNLIKQAEDKAGELRYSLLQTVREFALEKLRESGEAEAIEQRYIAYFTAYLTKLDLALKSAGQVAAVRTIRSEYDNIRSILHRAIERKDGAVALQLSADLAFFWSIQGYSSEARAFLEQALALATNSDPKQHARALHIAGRMSSRHGDQITARTYLQASLTLAKTLGDKALIANALDVLGGIAVNQGDYALAYRYLHEDLAIRREINDQPGIAGSLYNVGTLANWQADFELAKTYHQESLAIQQELGNKRGIGYSLMALGNTANSQGDYETATAYAQEGLAIAREIGEKRLTAFNLMTLGFGAYYQADYEVAKIYGQESLSILQEGSDKISLASSLMFLGIITGKQGDYATATAYCQESLAIQYAIGEKGGVACSLCYLGSIANRQADWSQALKFISESLVLAKEVSDKTLIIEDLAVLIQILLNTNLAAEPLIQIGGVVASFLTATKYVPEKGDYQAYREAIAILRTRTTPDQFEAFWTKGQTMTLEQAIEYALSLNTGFKPTC